MGFRDYIAKRLSTSASEPSFGVHTVSYSTKLAGKMDTVDPSKPLSTKVTPEIRRVPKEELEACYLSESTVFNSINKITEIVMAADYTLKGSDKSVEFFNGFFDEIGSRGGKMDWEQLLYSIFKHQMIFGDAWVELIPSKKVKDKIVDLQVIDPKTMDYAKNSMGKIVLDGQGNSVGYTQTLPYEYVAENPFKSPEEVALLSNQVFMPPERIAHFKLHTLGDLFYPCGLIEPSYNAIKRKIALEKAHANSVNRIGFPRLKLTAGNENYRPTDEQIQRAIEKMRDSDSKEVFGLPFGMDLQYLEARSPERLHQHLQYYVGQIITGVGLPSALVTGFGDQTGRTTLNRQEALAKLTLKGIVRRTLEILHREVIARVAKSNDIDKVLIEWGQISLEELDGKAKRLSNYARFGLLTPDENLENLIRKIEDMPEFDKNAARPKPEPKQKPEDRDED